MSANDLINKLAARVDLLERRLVVTSKSLATYGSHPLIESANAKVLNSTLDLSLPIYDKKVAVAAQKDMLEHLEYCASSTNRDMAWERYELIAAKLNQYDEDM